VKAVPPQVRMGQDQYLRWTGGAYFLSPYPTARQSTVVSLPSKRFTISPEALDAAVDGKKIILGEYKDVAAYQRRPMAIRYHQPAALLTARDFHKHILVSHWGNIGVKEQYTLYNPGPIADFEIQRGQPEFRMPQVSNAVAILPKTATDVLYRDLVGNVTSSNLRAAGSKSRRLELEFRYPLYGGWKVFFWYEYSTNLLSYLTKGSETNQYLLRINFEPTLDPAPAIQDFTISIVLPEGAHIKSVTFPPGLELETDPLSLSYPTLSLTGSPTLRYRSRYYLPGQLQGRMMEINYTYSRLNQLRAPFAIAAFFLSCFTFVIAYARLDDALAMLSPDPKAKTQ